MSQIKLTADSGGGTTSLKAPSSTTSNADVVLKLPVADGSANQVLKTDGSGQLSFTSNAGTTINNNADNRVITGSGTANTLEGESGLTYDGSTLQVSGNVDLSDNNKLMIGDSDDLQIDHSGTNSQIYHNGTGHLYIATLGSGEDLIIQAKNEFKVSTADSERMRIDSSGNVGIGTTSPARKFVVTEATANRIANFTTGGSSGAFIAFLDSNTTDDGKCRVGSIGGNALGMRGDSHSFQDGAGNTKMQIDSSGHTFFSGMTSLTASSSNKGINIENSTNNGRMNFHANSSAGNALGVGFYNNGSAVGTIYYSSSATTYNTSSDYRLKENVTAISDGITRLKTLKPSRFNFKVDKDTTVDGFLAHEVTAVPEAISGTKDEVDSDNKPIYQGIDQSKLVPLLTAALQEAVGKIETLETKVAALEGA